MKRTTAECPACGLKFQTIRKAAADTALPCPHCGSKADMAERRKTARPDDKIKTAKRKLRIGRDL